MACSRITGEVVARMTRFFGTIGRAVRAAAVLTIAVTSLGFAAATGASAAPTAAGDRTANQVRATMTLDCSALDAAKRQYAVDHNYCPPVSAAEKAGGPGTQNVVAGNCGTSFMWIKNRFLGTADFQVGADSTLGSIVQVSWNVSWFNQRNGSGGGFGDANWPFSSHWENTSRRFTDWGVVGGALTGTAVLWWGGTCAIGVPMDSTIVFF
jgi:hypothetical protein